MQKLLKVGQQVSTQVCKPIRDMMLPGVARRVDARVGFRIIVILDIARDNVILQLSLMTTARRAPVTPYNILHGHFGTRT
jgi:hypothetical protein